MYTDTGTGIIRTEVLTGSGTDKIEEDVVNDNVYSRSIGFRNYELKDQLGNVRVVISDIKEPSDPTNLSIFQSSISNSSDYYSYGALMPGRDYNSDTYRYGFQGKEKDDELKGNGNSYDFGARMLDTRVGRWLSIDPLAEKFPSVNPYNAMDNNPINMIDPDGAKVDMTNALKADYTSYDEDAERRIKRKKEDMNLLMSDLQEETGLTLYIDDKNLLQYRKREENNPDIAYDVVNGMINTKGSECARKMLISAINNNETLNIAFKTTNGSNASEEGSVILDVNQIHEFIAGTSNLLNKGAMGMGMVFFHELLHTDIIMDPNIFKEYGYTGSGNFEDSQSADGGDVVVRVNIIMAQLGKEYGQRIGYNARCISVNGGLFFVVYFNQDLYNRNENANYKYGKVDLSGDDAQYILIRREVKSSDSEN